MRNHGPISTRRSEWYIIGTITGASVTAAIAVLLMALGLHDATITGIKNWDTLLTGVMALAGALATVHWIQRQIDQARDQENDRIERAHFADRATLPAALANVVEYAERGLAALRLIPQPGAIVLRLEPPAGWTAPSLPHIPAFAVQVMRACIETAHPAAREQMASLLRHLQICNSRLHGMFEEEFVPDSRIVLTVHDMHTLFADFVELHLRSDRMIRYARGETAEIENPATVSNMITRSMFSNLEHYPGYLDEIRRRYRKDS